MRVLAISTPSTTHFMPAVPLLWALRAAGHEVLFVGQPDVVGVGRAAGLSTLAVGDPFGANDFFFGLPEGKRPIEAGIAQIPHDGWAGTGTAWVYHAKYLLTRYLDVARSWRPDLIIADPLEYAGLVIGAVLGVPSVHHRWGPELMTPAGGKLARRMLRGQAERLGLEDGVPQPTLVLDPYPAAWAIPDQPTGQPIRPVPYNGGGVVPEWAGRKAAERRVCVTFGLATLKLNGLPLVRHVVDAFDGLADVEALVTVDGGHRDQLGPVPDNVRLVEPAPLNTFVAGCDAVVHHGGAGTTTTALMAGLPHLLLPQMMDQLIRCERIEASGAAVRIPEAADQNNPDVIRDALIALLEQPRYRESAVALRADAEAMPSPAEWVGRLEELAAEARHARPARTHP